MTGHDLATTVPTSVKRSGTIENTSQTNSVGRPSEGVSGPFMPIPKIIAAAKPKLNATTTLLATGFIGYPDNVR